MLTECYSAAKNYFIKYGELGVLNCAAERVMTNLIGIMPFQRVEPMNSHLNVFDVPAVSWA